MRELVYLSQRKLETFVLQRRHRWWNRFRAQIDLAIPGVGSLTVEGDGTDHFQVDIARVIDALERSERSSHWFEDSNISPGMWIHFETQLNWAILDEARFKSAVFFLNHPHGVGTELLLHGAARHLVGRRPNEVDLELGYTWVESETGIFHTEPASPDNDRQVAKIGNELAMIAADPMTTDPNVESLDLSQREFVEPFPNNYISNQIHSVIGRLCLIFGPNAGAWMAGFARVTAIVRPQEDHGEPGTVVATPLYVEFVSEPKAEI